MKSQEKIIRLLTGLQGSRFDLVDLKIMSERRTWIYEIEPNGESRLCGICHRVASKHSCETILIQDLPVGVEAQEVWFRVKRWRVICERHGHQVEWIPFRSETARITKRLEAFIEELLFTKMITVNDIARTFKLHWDTVFKIDMNGLIRRYRQMKKPSPKNIAVDEKSFRRGHKYVTIVIDSDLKKVIFVSVGRTKDSLDQFFRWLGKERCQAIETIAMDLHPDYWKSVREHAPKAIAVPDKFHIVKELNSAIEEAFRELRFKETGEMTTRIPIDVKWLIKRNLSNQSDTQMQTLGRLKERNEALFEAYLLKDYFLHFFAFSESQIEEAQKFLVNWVTEAWRTGIQALQRYALFVRRREKILLNVIRTGRTSSICEGINNKIGKLLAMAYGYKRIDYLQLKILQKVGILGDTR